MYKAALTSMTLAIFMATNVHALDLSSETKECMARPPVDPKEEFALFYQLQSRSVNSMSGAKRIYYGKGLDQYGDLRLPEGKGPFPVVIVVHGGSWMSAVSSDYTAPLAELLAKQGYATWNIEYNRIGSGGEWPGSFKSVGAAADYIRVLAESYPIDEDQVVTIGHSSGGHYALWLAGRHNIQPTSDIFMENPVSIKGVVSLDGSPNLEAFAALPRGKDVIPVLMGNPSPDVLADRYKDGSPSELLPLGTPQVFITQQSDRLPAISDYIEKGTALGDSITYTVLCPSNHFTTVDIENSAARAAIINAVESLQAP